jgi:transposase
MRIMILALERWTAPAIAMAVGLSRRICQRWVAHYNEQGLSGLDDLRGQKSELPLTEEQLAIVRERVKAGPTEQDAVCSLRGKDFQRILAEEFGLLCSLSSVYWLLHRLGYSYLRPRPPPAAILERRQHPGDRLRFLWPSSLSRRFSRLRCGNQRSRHQESANHNAALPSRCQWRRVSIPSRAAMITASLADSITGSSMAGVDWLLDAVC